MTGESPSRLSPLDAVSDMRATARWLLASAAAVGAVLIGGAPLAAVGKLHGLGSAVTAYAGLVIGLCGVGWAIWHTAEAMIPPLTTPASLDTDPSLSRLRAEIARDAPAFFGPFGESTADLRAATAFHQRVADNLATTLAREPDEVRRLMLSDRLDAARTTVAAVNVRMQTLLELAHAWRVRAQLRRARLHTFAGGALTALGVVVFLAATSATR